MRPCLTYPDLHQGSRVWTNVAYRIFTDRVPYCSLDSSRVSQRLGTPEASSQALLLPVICAFLAPPLALSFALSSSNHRSPWVSRVFLWGLQQKHKSAGFTYWPPFAVRRTWICEWYRVSWSISKSVSNRWNNNLRSSLAYSPLPLHTDPNAHTTATGPRLPTTTDQNSAGFLRAM